MPSRIIPKNYRNVTGVAAHKKAVGKAMFESTLERDFLSLLEFDSDVESFEVQPIRIDWIDDEGKNRSYTPDGLIHYRKKNRPPRLFEVKYRNELAEKWQTLKPKFRAAIRFAKQEGWRFKLVTDKEIRTSYLDSVKFLLPYVRQGPSDEAHVDLLIEKLKILDVTTPALLIQNIFQDQWNQAMLIPSMWYLVGTKQIGCNLNQKLTMSSKIWILN
ncbi:heteromeric transposase endonuclease subunit TnsA [Alteromonadaceae bacterium M269]|nr:heteromeric transposase endonuclease subunit TnsA [Alteromonadaceae bacterium M269]